MDMYSNAAVLLNNALIFVIFFVCWVQPSAPRMLAALSFSVVSIALVFIDSYLTDYQAYLVPGIAAVFIMILVSAAAQLSSVAMSINQICLASIVLNCAGYIIYESGSSPIVYNISFTLLYLLTIIALLKKDGRSDAAGFGRDTWRDAFSYSNTSWFKYLFKGKEEI